MGTEIPTIDIVDHHGAKVPTDHLEYEEQLLAHTYIEKGDTVLELGARYGSVSCRIGHKLEDKSKHIAVEPDSRVWDALETNKQVNGGSFQIVKGFISGKKLNLTNIDYWHGGYGATSQEDDNSTIPSYTLDEIVSQYGFDFNVLVADCEGFLETFLNENPELYSKLRLLIFEADYPEKCNYDKVRSNLRQSGFIELERGHQNVWRREIV